MPIYQNTALASEHTNAGLDEEVKTMEVEMKQLQEKIVGNLK